MKFNITRTNTTMKKFLLAVFAVLGLTTVSMAGVSAPKDQSGETLPTMDFVGADTCRLTSADTTSGKLCFSGKGQVYGVSVSSDAATNFMVLRDSATANTSSTPSLILWNTSGGANTQLQVLPAPAKFSNGLSANVAATIPAAGSLGAQSEWVIYYRKQSATE
jgi:hypothetical protein